MRYQGGGYTQQDFNNSVAQRMREHADARQQFKGEAERTSILAWAFLAVREALTNHVHMLPTDDLSESDIAQMAQALASAAITICNQ